MSNEKLVDTIPPSDDNFKLKYKRVSYMEVEYGAFEDLVNKTYGTTDYSFPADRECGNDSSHDFTVKKEALDDYDEKRLKEFIESNCRKIFMTNTILRDLCNKDIIAPGEYLIHVCW